MNRLWLLTLFLLVPMLISSCTRNAPLTDHSSPSPRANSPMPAVNDTWNQFQLQYRDEMMQLEASAQASHTANPEPPVPPTRMDIRGLYVSAHAAQGEFLESILETIRSSNLNAVVLDVKDDYGRMMYASEVPLVGQLRADAKPILPDIRQTLQRLKEEGIYTIGRVVAFKDPLFAKAKPEYAIQNKSGGVWQDGKGVSWVDPYRDEVLRYNIDIAVEAVKLGFDEIQYDYVRFPENGEKLDAEAAFFNPNRWSKEQIIAAFLRMAKEQIHREGKPLSADVFGMIATARDDMGIGQNWSLLTQQVDVISPMVYPSHYGAGLYGVDHPDLEPYRIIASTIQDAIERNRELDQGAAIRPWLQAFTATWIDPHQTYGPAQVQEQVRALKDLGIEQYLLWNPSCRYNL
ncbi:putative glycoside hydrolase [Cohnella sp.]|uniref:putative glycoside hydrolase n=1 Tax=Cohnella sp. TaxID=1883426 RepID=UPI00356959E9